MQSKIEIGNNVVIEIPLADSSVTMLVGKLENRTPESFILSQAAFIKDTGRRTLFFAGEFDTNCEIEVYPEDMQIEGPARGCIFYAWPHALPKDMR
jgi:hypothetical protein